MADLLSKTESTAAITELHQFDPNSDPNCSTLGTGSFGHGFVAAAERGYTTEPHPCQRGPACRIVATEGPEMGFLGVRIGSGLFTSSPPSAQPRDPEL